MLSRLAHFLCFMLAVQAAAQDVPFTAERFKENPAGFTAAFESMQQGDEYFLNTPPMYQHAIFYYEKAHAFNPDNALLNFRLGVCYLHSDHKFKALDFLNKALALNPKVDPEIHFYLGQSMQINYEWDNAIAEYKLYQSSLYENKDAEKVQEAKKKIGECNTGIALTAKPENVKVENLGPEVNSSNAEYNPHISADESVLIFTSRRNDTYGGAVDKYDDHYFEDIYISEKVNDQWTKARNIGPPVNTKSHDAAAGISADGHTLFVFKGDRNAGDIMVSQLGNGRWTKPEDISKLVNSDAHESSACLSSDGNILYFVSDMPGGYGGRDIYKSKWNLGRQEWGEPQNLGVAINTPYDEEGVFIHPDGKTLYFSSKGHKTMGGYDIFISRFEKGRWSEPQNIGSPINTPDDDVFFEVSASGIHGYYASFKKEGMGEKDIYMVTFNAPTITLSKMAILKGVVTDANTGKPLNARIELIDLSKNEHIGVFNTDVKTGKYLVSLPSGVNYAAVIYADGYLFESENFNLPDTASYKEFHMDMKLKPLSEGNAIVLNNIFFDTDKFDLKTESTNELERLTKLMKSYPTMRIEIAGYTDNKGSDDYNLKLSTLRAKSVVDYMISAGVDPARLTYKGYGKERPAASNETAEGRQLNRRIEFKILNK